MALISSCTHREPTLQLLSHRTLRLPSASAIIFAQDQFWVFGDDAPYVSVLSIDHEELTSIPFWEGIKQRIPKDQKPDIESAFISHQNNKTILHAVGSQSAPARWQQFKFDVATKSLLNIVQLDSTAAWPGISERNIEGSCLVGTALVIANRGTLSQPQNHLLFWKDTGVLVKKLNLPSGKIFAGVSDLCYEPELDILFFTASEEATTNAYEDGVIGESYLGWIIDFSKRMNDEAFQPSSWLTLSKIDKAFESQKIEGICVEKIDGRRLTLDLVSDNDGAVSKIFKVSLTL